MIKMSSVPLILKGSVGVTLLLLFWFLAFLLTYGIFIGQYKEKKRYIPLICAMLICTYLALQCVATGITQKDQNPFWQKLANDFLGLPVLVIFIGIASCILCAGYLLYDAIRWRKKHITNFSVKQAVDYLPVGICYYDVNGRILLKNILMDEVCVCATNDALSNGQLFYDKITENKSEHQIQMEELFHSNLLFLDDHRVFSVEKTLQNQIQLLLLYDITDEYQKTMELIKKQERMQELNLRLNLYNQEVVHFIAEKEVLQAKIKIHDEIGITLLKIKQYILQKEINQEEKSSIIRALRQNVQFLLQESEEKKKDEFAKLSEIAESLGVKVCVEGELPDAKVPREIIVNATHECLTNTIRHARGNELYLKIEQEESVVIVTITNNGETPNAKIVEKGGLLSLRNLVEEVGGRMQVSWENGFKLVLHIPREDKYEL